MKKTMAFLVFSATAILIVFSSAAQQPNGINNTVIGNKQIAVFTPLYLDSAFDNTITYRYGSEFPKFLNPGLEFYTGIEMATDSLRKEGAGLDIHIYDTRSSTRKVSDVINSAEFEKMNLIIGHVTGTEAVLLAGLASRKSIPFINVNYPNDAGIKNNPNYVILNSTLITHFTSIYKYLQKHHSLSTITYFMKKGNAEETIKKYFETIEKNTVSVPLKLKFVTLPTGFTEKDIEKHLNSNDSNFCIGGSLDLHFAQQLSHKLAILNQTYPVALFGMPTWDAADFTKPEYKHLEIYYSTPFYIDENNPLTKHVSESFTARFYSRPSDMVFRGYETLYHFGRLLLTYGSNLSTGLTDKRHKLFTDFEINPVINPNTMTLDYFENKKIYMVKMVDGKIVQAN